MRPTKLTYNLLQAFQSVLSDELAVIAFTEEELVWQANQKLAREERITYRTYQRYKADILLQETQDDGHKLQDLPEENAVIETENTELVQQMYVCMKEALMKQKLALVRGVYAQQPNWRRFCWMLERKFPDFRLRTASHSIADGRWPMEKNLALASSETSNNPPKPPKPEPTELETITAKWQRLPYESASPWGQGPDFYQFHMTPEQVRSLEEEMAEDEAKGYVNPYGNLGYQPVTCPEDVDYNTYENGWYTFFTMGDEQGPRLPICLWARQQIRMAPKKAIKELIWAEQEWERRHPGEPYPGETVPVEAWPEYPWPEKLPRADPDDPERPYDPDRSTAHVRGRILGFSG